MIKSLPLVYIGLSVFTGYISLEAQKQARLTMEENFWVKYLFGPIIRLCPRLCPDPIAQTQEEGGCGSTYSLPSNQGGRCGNQFAGQTHRGRGLGVWHHAHCYYLHS